MKGAMNLLERAGLLGTRRGETPLSPSHTFGAEDVNKATCLDGTEDGPARLHSARCRTLT